MSILALVPSVTTLALAAAVIFLAIELYKRLFLVFNDDVPTSVAIPLLTRPPISRVEDMHDFELENMRKSGSAVIRTVGAHKPWARSVLVADPVVLKEIFAGPQWQKFDRYHPNQDSMVHHAGGLILMPNGEHWREAREHLGTRTFSSTTIRTYVPILREMFSTFHSEIKKEMAAHDGNVDLQAYFNRMTFDAIVRLVFGESVNAQTTPEGAKYLDAWDGVLGLANILSLLQSLASQWSWKLFPGIVNKFKKDIDMIYSLVWNNVERRKRGEDLSRVSILDDFMSNPKVNEWLKQDDEVARQLVTLLFAGHDTTAALLSFMTYYLATNPVWQTRVREEAIAAFGKPAGDDDLVSNLDKLEGLPILNACLKETLRLQPSAPFGGGRVMNQDLLYEYTDLAGNKKQIDFRKGDAVLPFVYGAQRNQDFWDKRFGPVDEFNPERFLQDPNGGAKTQWAMNPFGNGARKCAGERLALGEARLTIAELARRYEWRMQPDAKFSVLMTGTIKAKNGVKIKMTPLKA